MFESGLAERRRLLFHLKDVITLLLIDTIADKAASSATSAATIMTTNATKSTKNDDANDEVGSSSAAADVASTSAPSEPFENDSAYSKAGLAMWLNNTPDRAEQHFRARLDSTQIFAGYAFVVSMVSTGYVEAFSIRCRLCSIFKSWNRVNWD